MELHRVIFLSSRAALASVHGWWGHDIEVEALSPPQRVDLYKDLRQARRRVALSKLRNLLR